MLAVLTDGHNGTVRFLFVVLPVVPDFRSGSLGSIHSVLLLLSESCGLPHSHFVALVCTSLVCESTPVVHSCYPLRIVLHIMPATPAVCRSAVAPSS
jgi:hypothetical protein